MELSFDLRNNNFDVRKSFSAVWEHAGTHYFDTGLIGLWILDFFLFLDVFSLRSFK
jgi:hypothetical protein